MRGTLSLGLPSSSGDRVLAEAHLGLLSVGLVPGVRAHHGAVVQVVELFQVPVPLVLRDESGGTLVMVCGSISPRSGWCSYADFPASQELLTP